MSLDAMITEGEQSSSATESLRLMSPEPMAAGDAPNASASRPAEQPKIQRHKSVSRRVFSSLRNNLAHATSRTRSTQSIRPIDSETSLVQKPPSKRNPSTEASSERRAYSFDVSRESVASDADIDNGESSEPAFYGGYAVQHRSATDSTVSTSALIEELETTQVAPGTPTPGKVVLLHRYSSLAPSPPPKYPARLEHTPRPIDRPPTAPTIAPVQSVMAVPFVELDVRVDQPTLDVSTESNVWIAIEASVQTQLVDYTPPVG